MLRDDVMNISPVRIVSTEITIKCPYFVFRLISICLMLSGVTTGVATERRQQDTVLIIKQSTKFRESFIWIGANLTGISLLKALSPVLGGRAGKLLDNFEVLDETAPGSILDGDTLMTSVFSDLLFI